MIDAREIEPKESHYDPEVVETGRQLVAWIEATSRRWIGGRRIGEHQYALIADEYRQTPTQNALVLLSNDRTKWIAMSEPSFPTMATAEMTMATDEHFVQLVRDVEILEEARRLQQAMDEKQAEIRMLGQGCLDLVTGRDTDAAKYYLGTCQSG